MNYIQPTGYVQWTIYKIIREAFMPYRKIDVISPEISQDDFTTELRFKKYVLIQGIDEQKTNINIVIMTRDENGTNRFITFTEDMKFFEKEVVAPNTKTIVISPAAPAAHVQTFINKLDHDSMQIFNYDMFKIVLPLGPYVPLHQIINDPDEEKYIYQTLFKDKKCKIKQIGKYDPQLIWVPGEVGQLVKLTNVSGLTGVSIEYRIIVE